MWGTEGRPRGRTFGRRTHSGMRRITWTQAMRHWPWDPSSHQPGAHEYAANGQKNAPQHKLRGVLKGFRRRPTLPHKISCSTIGAKELNFRVRDGIGCGLLAITTGEAVHRMRLINRAQEPGSWMQQAPQRKGEDKPHDPLVLVSSTCCHASTPSLSTS